MGEVTISMLYVIGLCVLHFALSEFFCIGKFVIYISCSGVILS